MKKFSLLLFVLSLPLLLISQEKWEGGLFLGYSNYMGEMTEPSFTLNESSPAFGILLRNHLSNNFGLRMNLLYGKLKGDDNNYDRLKGRGASFESSLVEISLMGEYEPFGHRRYGENGSFNKIVSPYIFAGLGAAFGNPKVQNGESVDYSSTYFSMPVGGGIKFDLSQKVNLGFELGGRLSFSDALDGISEQKGNPDQNDVYFMGGAVLGFRFGDKDTDNDGVADEDDKCPTQAGPVALGGCPDADGDGLADRDDNCPNEAGEVRLNGCPDRDGDGVADNVDDCPDEAGLRRFSGCPDTDGDNIVDKEDNCPTVAGIPAMNGCPDADRDGITDAQDDCPNDPGTAEHRGCPDTDNDGISDKDDACPRDPGTQKFNGCPDSDNDGIADPNDKCPLLAGLAANDGCPDIKKEDKAVLDEAMRSVQFESGSARLLRSSNQILNQIAEIIKRYPGFKLEIDGYTDSVGNDFANQQLSENRARACYNYLADKGVDKSLMTFKGHGESNPVASNSTSSGRRQNRRVTFTLTPM